MVRDVAFGQYFPAKSLIHRLDPRAKIIMLVAFLVLVFCTFNYAALALVAASTAAIVAMSGVPAKFYFKSLKIIIFMQYCYYYVLLLLIYYVLKLLIENIQI